MSAQNQNLHVSVRVRPLLPGEHPPADPAAPGITVSLPAKTVTVAAGRDSRDGGRIELKFDGILWSAGGDIPTADKSTDQGVVYEAVGAPVLAGALAGYNGCIMAHGQSGSGKTYTMFGDADNPGIVPRITDDLFARIAQPPISGSTSSEWHLEIGAVEVYNDRVSDLLVPVGAAEKHLTPQDMGARGIWCADQIFEPAPTAKAAHATVLRALNRRRVAATKNNRESSRTHAIVVFVLKETREMLPSGSSVPIRTPGRTARLFLVDLAGSERFSKAGDASGNRLVETQHINSSLFVLGKVVDMLAAMNRGSPLNTPPYRESKLTYLLKDALGGNCVTKLIATVSPAPAAAEESLSTLRYASRARQVKLVARANEDPKAKRIRELEELLAQLRDERSRAAGDDPKLAARIDAAEAQARQWALSFEAEQRAKVSAEARLREIHEVLEKRSDLDSQMDAMEREARAHEMEIQRLAREHDRLAARVPELEHEVERSNEAMAKMRAEIDALRVVEGDLARTREELEAERHHCSTATADLRSEIARVSQELEERTGEDAEAIAALQAEKQRLERTLDERTKQLLHLESMARHLDQMRSRVLADQVKSVAVAEADARGGLLTDFYHQREVFLSGHAAAAVCLQGDLAARDLNAADLEIAKLQEQLDDRGAEQVAVDERDALATQLSAERAEREQLTKSCAALEASVVQASEGMAKLSTERAAVAEELAASRQSESEALQRLALSQRRVDATHALLSGLRPLQQQVIKSIASHVSQARGLKHIHQWNVRKDDFTNTWRLATTLTVAPHETWGAVPPDEDPRQLERTQSAVLERNDLARLYADLEALLDVTQWERDPLVSIDFFTGSAPQDAPLAMLFADLAFVAGLFEEASDDRAASAAQLFAAHLKRIEALVIALLSNDVSNQLVCEVRDIDDGSRAPVHGRKGFSCMAAANELLVFARHTYQLAECLPKLAVVECKFSAANRAFLERVRSCVVAELRRLPSSANTTGACDVDACADKLVSAFEWVRGTRDGEGRVIRLGATADVIVAALDAAAEELMDGVPSVEAKLQIRDRIYALGKDEVLRLRPLAALEALDLHSIAKAWSPRSAAEYTYTTKSLAAAPSAEVDRLEAHGKAIAAEVDAVLKRHFTAALRSDCAPDATGYPVADALKAEASEAADAVLKKPADTGALDKLVAVSCAIVAYSTTPLRNMRDFVKGGCVTRGLLLVPHDVQLTAAMRVLGLQEEAPGFVGAALKAADGAPCHLRDFLHNHLLEVGTGQGKSVLFAVLAVTVGLLGVPCDVVCFNRLLSRRDRGAVRGFGANNGLAFFLGANAPRFLTFTELAFAQATRPRALVKCALEGQHPGDTLASTLLSGAAGLAERKRLVLIDEVDAFFEIAGEDFTAGVALDGATTRKAFQALCEELASADGALAGGRREEHVALLADALEGAMPSGLAADFAPQVVSKLCEAAALVFGGKPDDMHGHELRNGCEIGKVDESDFFDPAYRDLWIAPMLYWREVKKAGGRLQSDRCAALVRDVHSVRVVVPPVTYAWLLQECYFGVVGVSGTLRTLPAALVEDMQTHVIGEVRHWTYVPPLHTLQAGRSAAGDAAGETSEAMLVQRDVKCAWPVVGPSDLLCRSFEPPRALFDAVQDCLPMLKRIAVAADELQAWRSEVAAAVTAHRAQPRAVVGGGQALVVFEDARRMKEFMGSKEGKALLEGLGVDSTVVLGPGLSETEVAERVEQAMGQRVVTFMTRSYGRGTDFKARKRDVVLVVQTFVSTTASEEFQIRGRTARADRAGRYMLIFAPSQAASALEAPDVKSTAVEHVAAAGESAAQLFVCERAALTSASVERLEEERSGLTVSSAEFGCLYRPPPDYTAADVIAAVAPFNVPHARPETANTNAVVTFVIDLSSSMQDRVADSSNTTRQQAVAAAMEQLHTTTLRKLGSAVKWRVITFGKRGNLLAQGDFSPASSTPHGAYASARAPGIGKFFTKGMEELEKQLANESGDLADDAQHYVFWFTDGAPHDDQLSLQPRCEYETTLYAPSRKQYAVHVTPSGAPRVAMFRVVLLDHSESAGATLAILETFAECFEGTASKTVDTKSLAKEFLDFGASLKQRTALR